MGTALTDAGIKILPIPAKGHHVYYDPNPAGFGVRVTTAGVRSFIFTYRVRDTQRQRQMTIGRCSNWKVAQARAEAKRLRREVDAGGDPHGDIAAVREAPTVAELLDRFEEEHVRPRLRPNTQRQYRMLLERHIRPHFGANVKVAGVEFADIDALHRAVTRDGGDYVANRAVGVLSKVFALAIRWKMRDDNPAKGVARNLEVKRKRYLNGDELARLVKALASHPNMQAADIIRLALTTGCRIGEAFSAAWADLDLTEGVWSKPASATKQRQEHIVPLSAPARALLADIQERQTAGRRSLGPWVFPSHGGTGHITNINKAWRSICKAAGITGLRIHDLRHSFASMAISSGNTSLAMVGALLGHSEPKTTSRYAHLMSDPLRAVAERVGAEIVAAGGKAGGTVEPFPPKGKRHGRR